MHPASSANPILRIIERGFATGGAAVAPFPDTVPARGMVLLHWSEFLWMDRLAVRRKAAVSTSGGREERRAEFLAALDAAHQRALPVIWVRHDTVPFGWSGSIEDWDRRIATLARRVDGIVHLHPESVALDRDRPWSTLPATIIPHPRYDPAGAGGAAEPRNEHAGHALVLGGIEARKGHDRIVAAALGAGLHVTVAGKANDPRLVRRLRWRRLTSRGRLELRVGYVTDPELDALLMATPVVLIDQPDQRNSGVVWLALSRGSVVIGTDSPALRAGRDVGGADRVRIIPRMDSEGLAAALRAPLPRGTSGLDALVTGQEFAARLRRFADGLVLERRADLRE